MAKLKDTGKLIVQNPSITSKKSISIDITSSRSTDSPAIFGINYSFEISRPKPFNHLPINLEVKKISSKEHSAFRLSICNQSNHKLANLVINFPIPTGENLEPKLFENIFEMNDLYHYKIQDSNLFLFWKIFEPNEKKTLDLKFDSIFKVDNRLNAPICAYLRLDSSQKCLIYLNNS